MARVLVVDDEADIRLLVRITLEHAGYEVIEAVDGASALAAVAEQHPDLMLLDVMMPDVDGWTVLETLKAADDRLLVETPVLMLTALGGPLDQIKGAIEGALRYLTKPIDLGELVDAVGESLEGPEPAKRRRAQQQALEMLARIEANGSTTPSFASGPRPRLSGLERERTPTRSARPAAVRVAADRVAQLTDKQRVLLEAVLEAPTVLEASARLAMSRSNIYASLRRISRKLGVASVPELLNLLRAGLLLPGPSGEE